MEISRIGPWLIEYCSIYGEDEGRGVVRLNVYHVEDGNGFYKCLELREELSPEKVLKICGLEPAMV